jgi:hypothetical protein
MLHHQHVQAQAKHTAAVATAAAAAVGRAPMHMQDAHAQTRMCTHTHTRTRTGWAKCPPGLVREWLKYFLKGSLGLPGVTFNIYQFWDQKEHGKVGYSGLNVHEQEGAKSTTFGLHVSIQIQFICLAF